MRTGRVVWVGLALSLLACGKERSPPPPAELAVASARACTHDSEISCGRPIFNVHDLQKSLGYYRDVLGYKVDWQDGKPADFASVSRGDGVLFLCQGCQGTPGAWAMYIARDVDKLHREITGKGARVRLPPTDMPWGLREMHVSDLDGNVLRYGTDLDEE